MHRLPFREVWGVDFEFLSEPGERPVPVCMVAKEFRSGRLLRLWRDELPARPPLPLGPESLFVAYLASAELGCFLQLGWPMPARILDLYVEFRNATNGSALPNGKGLLGALSYHGLPGITSEEKRTGRELVMRGGPWTAADRVAILDYCQTDVDPMGPLLERMLPGILRTREGLGQALLRGRYMAAVACMEHTGVPIDVDILKRLRDRWGDLKLSLVAEVDAEYGFYEGASFKADRFEAWLDARRIAWPRTETGRLSLGRDTFRDMSTTHPELAPVKELRHALSDLRLEKLAVGADGRNRVMLSPFGARTGRNLPSANGFIFGPSVWLRGLIRPDPGRALAYIDWSAQEVAIAAALSGDPALVEAAQSGDPYLAFATAAGLAPAGATKASHGRVRDMCKTCVLGANYGMQAPALALRVGASVIQAERLLRALATTYPMFWAWAQRVEDTGQLTGQLATVYGWEQHFAAGARPTAMRNYPVQANAAEMLRVACCLATERGIAVCAPVHDALLVEGPAEEIGAVVEATKAAMREATTAVLGGLAIGTDVTVITDRYSDPRGQAMWDRIMGLLTSCT